MNEPFSATYAKNITFFICFIISFALMEGPRSMETIGIVLFLMVHFIFSLSFGKDIMEFFMIQSQSMEYTVRLYMVFVSVALSVAAAVMLALTIAKFQTTFSAVGQPITLNGENRKKLNDLITIFITVVVFLGAMGLNVYFTPESLFKFMFESLRKFSDIGDYFLVVVPFICFGIGSALYERMRIYCDSDGIQSFKENFHTTYWLLFGVIGVSLFKMFMEKVVFPHFQDATSVILNPWYIPIKKSWKIPFIIPLIPWDMFLDLAKWGIMISAVVFAGFTIRDYMGLNKHDGCFKHDLANLYVMFITLLFFIFFLTVITPLQLTQLVTFIVRFLVPPTTLALVCYLVFLTNDMAHLSKGDLVK